MYTALNQYHVVMEVEPKFWQDPSGLQTVYIHPSTGGEVPLSTVARYAPTTAPLSVNHQGQFPSVTVSFNLAPGIFLSDVQREITKCSRALACLPRFAVCFPEHWRPIKHRWHQNRI